MVVVAGAGPGAPMAAGEEAAAEEGEVAEATVPFRACSTQRHLTVAVVLVVLIQMQVRLLVVLVLMALAPM